MVNKKEQKEIGMMPVLRRRRRRRRRTQALYIVVL
jgi:hypothetical protein